MAARDFEQAAAFVARMVESSRRADAGGHAAERQLPGGRGSGRARLPPRQAHLQRPLELDEEEGGRRRYRIYGDEPGYREEEGTDFAAIAEGRIAVTPLHFDLTDQAGIEALAGFDLDRLLRPAAREV